MERLTIRSKGTAFWADSRCAGGGYRVVDDVWDLKRLNRLADYEDICFSADGAELLSPELLRQVRAELKNNSLTLEQLLGMNGEPIWTVTIGVDGSGRWELCSCETITACPLHKVLRCVTSAGEVTDYELDTVGKTWLAYRRKPEKG